LTIEIENFTFNTIIGLLDFERVNEQRVIINLKASYRYKKNSFIDYVEICNTIKKNMQKNQYELLEDALIDIKDEIFSKFDIDFLTLKITKPDILADCEVSLLDSWHRG